MNSERITTVETEIIKIPGNEAVLEKLYELLDAGDSIGFVGAGASAGLWPLWDDFLRKFVAYGSKNGNVTDGEATFFVKEAATAPLETAQQLRDKIGDKRYFEFLQETFIDKTHAATGGAFTSTHKALLQLPIRNYITLNYDAGLTNARAALYPRATTSYYFWDQEEARRIRERNFKRQVLHAHGRHDRADSIILTLDDYRRCYGYRPFARLLDEVFASEKLLFIGFGMADPYIKRLFDNVNKDYTKSPLRHIALVGLEEADVGGCHLLRDRVEMMYGARTLFYPTTDHHAALNRWLSMLVERFANNPHSTAVEEVVPHIASATVMLAVPDRYIHLPTNDANFKGRVDDLRLLNRWANDPATRAIAITGIGGQGKTALTGKWIKDERCPELKALPVFYWSFYEDLDVGKFINEVVKFCLPIARGVSGDGEIDAVSLIMGIMQQARVLLVLDGLEVLQEDAESPAHGRINHPLLETFLQQWVRHPHMGLMILTSRFRFPVLEQYAGAGFHHLNLMRLSKEDGVALLVRLGVLGKVPLKTEYVEKLHGHPLALRVLAATVNRCCHGDLERFEGSSILDAVDEVDKLGQKLRHLLSFYEQQLKNGQKELLGIVSLFKRPIEMSAFVTLLQGMKSLAETPLATADETEIKKQLDALTDDFLIEKTRDGCITTHPVIRDYFRNGLNVAGSKREVADFLKARPGEEQPKNIEEVRDLVEAVQLLCDEGDFKAANDLRTDRLFKGSYEFNIFKDLPAVTEGLECSLAFVVDDARIKQVEKELGKAHLAVYYAGVSLCNLYLGNLSQALEWRKKTLDIRYSLQDKENQARSLSEIASIYYFMGDINNAHTMVSQALTLSHETRNLSDLRSVFAHQAYYEFVIGNLSIAFQEFKIALLYEQISSPEVKNLYAKNGNDYTEFLIRLNEYNLFESVNTWNIHTCEQYYLNRDLAVCHYLQAWSLIRRNRLPEAEASLHKSEKILRSSGMVEYTCRLDLIWSLLHEARGDFTKGLQRVNDSLYLCADKGFRLLQADHLVVRGRLHLLQFNKTTPPDLDTLEKTGDDGTEALAIAERTGYIWAKVDALDLLASYHTARALLPGKDAVADRESASRYDTESTTIKKTLLLTKQQMEELKLKAREEFEKQTVGWE